MPDPEAHALDEPLGDIHEDALCLSFLIGRAPDQEQRDLFYTLAMNLANAHETIQNWAMSLEI